MSSELFRIATSLFTLTWSSKRDITRTGHEALWSSPAGHLAIRPVRAGVEVPTVTRNVPASSGLDEDAAALDSAGPRLEEETEYLVYARARTSGAVLEVRHADPAISSQLRRERDGVVHGAVNFRSNVGFSEFEVLIDGRPVCAFIVEVFPTKLDYRSDYESLLADVQGVSTSLALEYLRSTYRMGRAAGSKPTDDLQWVLLLQDLFDDLETAVRHIASRPRRAVVRRESLRPVDRVRRTDARARRSIRQRQGSGHIVGIGHGVQARARIWTRPAEATLDTPEHRWLAHQLGLIQRRLADIVRVLTPADKELPLRRETQVGRLRDLEASAARLRRLEPFAATEGPPPPGFASQQLMAAPGYREAYQACLILRSGLNLQGDALRLATKEVHLLYEYWCYLTLVRMIGRLLDRPMEPKQLFRVQSSGLRMDLARGKQSEVTYDAGTHRVRVRFNPSFPSGDFVLVPQRPDVLITLEREGWPAMHLIVDAKYRVDSGQDYVRRYELPGPPDDALNVLYRYRDAILEQYEGGAARHTVQAAAMFPARDTESTNHEKARYWSSLAQIGVGAIPALPGQLEYVERWVLSSLERGGWTLSTSAIPHAAIAALNEYRELERQRVLVVFADELAASRIAATGSHEVAASPEAARADYLLLVVQRGDRAQLRQHPVTQQRLRHADADTSPLLELAVAELEKTSDVTADAAADQLPRISSMLAVGRAHRLSHLHLTLLEDWMLHDECETRGHPTTVDFTKADPLFPRPWLKIAAEARARYEGADGYAWEDRNGTIARYSDLERLLMEKLAAAGFSGGADAV